VDAVAVIAAFLVVLSGCAGHLPEIQATGSVPLTGRTTVDLCNAAISDQAAQYDPVSIETSLTRPVRGTADGRQIATLYVEIEYRSEVGMGPHSATVDCTVAPNGQVIGLKG
jgi:hypothetical protein